MIKYQTKRIIGKSTERVTVNFPTLSTSQRVVGIFCINENTADYGHVHFGLNIGGTEIFPENFPLKILTSHSNKTLHRNNKAGYKRYFDLVPFAIKAGGQSVTMSLRGNQNNYVDVILVLDDVPVAYTQSQTKKYQIVRIAQRLNSILLGNLLKRGIVKTLFTTLPDYSNVTGVCLIYHQLVNEFCYRDFSRLGLKIGGSEIFPLTYPANNLLLNAQCVQFDENFYDLKPFDIRAKGTTAEIVYEHSAPTSVSSFLDPDLVCVFELTK
ncbi:MAG: hypothetical protein FWE63_01985 [Bacteroidales bacterium]|nr:hypothetical protein [Bacteroidales bacterium]